MHIQKQQFSCFSISVSLQIIAGSPVKYKRTGNRSTSKTIKNAVHNKKTDRSGVEDYLELV